MPTGTVLAQGKDATALRALLAACPGNQAAQTSTSGAKGFVTTPAVIAPLLASFPADGHVAFNNPG